MPTDFSQQIALLEEILNRDFSPEAREAYRQKETERFQKRKWIKPIEDMVNDLLLERVFIKQTTLNYISRGGQQLVLRLDGDWVAKAANHYQLKESYVVKTCPHYIPGMLDTIDILNKEFGFDIPVCVARFRYENGQLRIKIGDEGYGAFMIAPDLTKNGKYLVRDIIPDEDFKQFSNGTQVRKEYERYSKRLLELYNQLEGYHKDTEFRARINPHAEDSSAETAIRKIFFLKIDPTTNTAEVVPGDFNHFFIYKRERDKRQHS